MMAVDPGSMTLTAAAKINLSLEILAPRADGFHEIRTIMQAIDLRDRIELRIDPGEGAIAVETSDPALPRDEQNLAGVAARRLLSAAGRQAAVQVRIDKRIPAGAGLGGGSSDAAATLWGLNRLLGRPLGAAALLRLAAAIGSDVPFFLAGGTCFCSGRGEKLRRLPPLPDCRILVATPALSVESQWAYANRARIGLTPSRGYTRMLESAIRQRRTSLVAQYLWNDFEALLCERFEVVKDAKNLLLGVGSIGAQVSGSGSAVFGLVPGEREACAAVRSLYKADHPVRLTRPVGAALVAQAEG